MVLREGGDIESEASDEEVDPDMPELEDDEEIDRAGRVSFSVTSGIDH